MSEFEVRVVAPSESWRPKQDQLYQAAVKRLSGCGYKVTFGVNIKNNSILGSAPARLRAKDLNTAFKDKNVKAILALNGGWSANEVLPYIDWSIVKANPKPLIGFSDISVIVNAVYAKTGNTAYLGPNLNSLGVGNSWRYTLDNFDKTLKQAQATIVPSKAWTVLQPGSASGRLIGGNLGSFYLLQGTEFQPSLQQPYILAVEDDDETGKYAAREFSRRLESILQLPGARKNIQGLFIGRFQPKSNMDDELLVKIIVSKQLKNIPILINMDFGHTQPMSMLPIGSTIELQATASAMITEKI